MNQSSIIIIIIIVIFSFHISIVHTVSVLFLRWKVVPARRSGGSAVAHRTLRGTIPKKFGNKLKAARMLESDREWNEIHHRASLCQRTVTRIDNRKKYTDFGRRRQHCRRSDGLRQLKWKSRTAAEVVMSEVLLSSDGIDVIAAALNRCFELTHSRSIECL